jgi:nucleotide-binding universal stress UspA family protein
VPVETKLVEGDPVLEILAAAASADVIVMGTHGARGFERFVLGSITEKVLRKATCPVMTIPRGELPGEERNFLFHTILCPVDFSDCSTDALRTACDLAKEMHGRLVLLHVVDWIGDEVPSASLQEAAYERLDALVPAGAPPARQIVRGGRAFREIARVADETGAGLIVMGVQGRGAIDLMLFGSTTHHVIREARCPVLTIRAPGAAPLETRASQALRATSEPTIVTGAGAGSPPS